MPEKKDQTTPQDLDTLGPEHLMPWEIAEPGAGGGDHQVAQALNELLEDDPEFADDDDGSRGPAAEDDQDDSVESDDDEPEEEELDDEDSDDGELEDESDDGEEDADEYHEEVELDDELLLTVKVDGEEQEVTLREALDGFQMRSDYTRKTQAIAAREKEIAAALEETGKAREQLGQQLALLEQALSGDGRTPEDWDKLREDDPNTFANEWAAHQHNQYKMQQLRALQEQNAAEYQKEQEQVLNTRLVEERNKLPSLIPEWKDDATVTTGLEEVKAYISDKYGATEDELNLIVDARFVAMARKAMLFDKASSAGDKKIRGKSRTKGKKSGRVLSPGARNKPSAKSQKKSGKKMTKARVKRYKAARARLGQTGRVEDAAAALLELEDE